MDRPCQIPPIPQCAVDGWSLSQRSHFILLEQGSIIRLSFVNANSVVNSNGQTFEAPCTPMMTILLLLMLLVLSALGDEQEMERTASATAPKYVRGGSVLKRGVCFRVRQSQSGGVCNEHTTYIAIRKHPTCQCHKTHESWVTSHGLNQIRTADNSESLKQ